MAEANEELSDAMHPKDELNYAKARRKIVAFINRKIEESGACGVVLGLSGGLDSAVTAFLCKEALGADKVLAVAMPHRDVTPKQDVERARSLAKDLGIRLKVMDIKPALDMDVRLLGKGDNLTKGNLMARTRMKYLYFYANRMNRLVAGTGDRSEITIGYYCYDAETRALTPEGFKCYWELKPGETVFSLNLETRQIVEAEVSKIHVFDYEGELLHFKGATYDLMVTPNHRMVVQTCHRTGLRLEEATDLLRYRRIFVPIPEPWTGLTSAENQVILTITQRHMPRTVRLDAKDFFYMLGLYLGDGFACKGGVSVEVKSTLTRPEYLSLSRGATGRFQVLLHPSPYTKTYETYDTYFALPKMDRARPRLEGILRRAGIHYSTTGLVVRTSCKELYDLFSSLGRGALNKQIPRWVLELPADDLRSLLYGLLDSDGTGHDPSQQWIIFTSSCHLAHQIPEICAKLGLWCSIVTRGPRESLISNKVIKSRPSYEIVVRHRARQLTLDTSRVSTVVYRGKVWCPEVPGYENLIVERNGRLIISGNTKFGDGGVDFLPIGGLYKTQVREMAKRLGVPREIVETPSSPVFWPGHRAEEEIGFSYELLDQALEMILRHRSAGAICRQTGLSMNELHRIREMMNTSAHKRMPPEICEL